MTRLPVPPPAELAALLPPEVDLKTGRGLRVDAPPDDVARLWYGVVWGRLGRGDLAWAWWDGLDTPALQPWLAAERGRLLRELGDHLAAQRLEEPALARADDPLDRVMLRVSLAADAVGCLDPDRARRCLAAARQELAAQPWSPRRDRQWLRVGWVTIEIALLAGEVVPAVPLPSWRHGTAADRSVATPAPSRRSRTPRDPVADAGGGSPVRIEGLLLPPSYRSASRFHVAKGCLFAGVVRADEELLALAADLAPAALRWAVQLARAALGIVGAAEAAALARADVVPPPPLA